MVSSCTTVMYPEKESDMSFSSEVKEELAKHISPARHCQIAELAALMNFSGQYGRSAEGDFMIGFQTENEAVVRKGFTLLKKTYNIDTDVKISEEQMRSVIDKIGDLSEPVSPLLILTSVSILYVFFNNVKPFLTTASFSVWKPIMKSPSAECDR